MPSSCLFDLLSPLPTIFTPVLLTHSPSSYLFLHYLYSLSLRSSFTHPSVYQLSSLLTHIRYLLIHLFTVMIRSPQHYSSFPLLILTTPHDSILPSNFPYIPPHSPSFHFPLLILFSTLLTHPLHKLPYSPSSSTFTHSPHPS